MDKHLENDILLDMDGRRIESGHIVAVRYCWNSYVGTARMRGLCAEGHVRHAFFSPHRFDDKATYQILGHVDKDHADFNQGVYDWYTSKDAKCPVEIRVYDNMPKV